MNRIILIFVALFVCMSSYMMAQYSEPLRLTRLYLMSHKWYPDVYGDEDFECSYITYSLTQEIDSVFTEKGEIELYVTEYYLSDAIDTVFDQNKVGKAVSGKYLITRLGSKDSDVFIMEVVFMSEHKMMLKILTEGWTSTGRINTYFSLFSVQKAADLGQFNIPEARSYFESQTNRFPFIRMPYSNRTDNRDVSRQVKMSPDWARAVRTVGKQAVLVEVPLKSDAMLVESISRSDGDKLIMSNNCVGHARLVLAQRMKGNVDMFVATLVPSPSYPNRKEDLESFRYLGGYGKFTGKVFCFTLDGRVVEASRYLRGNFLSKVHVYPLSLLERLSYDLSDVHYETVRFIPGVLPSDNGHKFNGFDIPDSMMNSFLPKYYASFVCVPGDVAEDIASPRLTREYLMSHKWYPDIYSKRTKESSVTCYTMTQKIDSIFKDKVCTGVNVMNYYLSNTKDTVFDANKVGKTTSGKYIIRELKGVKPEYDMVWVQEVVFVSKEKMALKHLVKGWSSYGNTTTYYTSPIRE